jgi:hypothetical protein
MVDFFGISDNTKPSGTFSLISALRDVTRANNVRAAAFARRNQALEPPRKLNQSKLDAQAREATRQIQAYSKLKTRQKSAVKTIEKVTKRLDEMKTLLLEAREFIVKAGRADITAEDRRVYANQFDQLIGKLNLKAKTAGRKFVNMIGGSARDVFSAQDLEVQVRPGSLATTSYTGKFLGSDYAITDLGGSTFLPNLFGSSVVQFPPPDPDDIGTLLRDDDTVVYDDATGSVTLTRNGEGTPFLEGTLEKKGLGVLHAYFYGDLDDAALRDTALSDVTDALQSLRSNIALFGSKLTRAEVALEYSEGTIEENRNVVGRIEGEKFITEQKFLLEQQKSELLFQQAFSLSQGTGSNGVLLLQQGALFDFEA